MLAWASAQSCRLRPRSQMGLCSHWEARLGRVCFLPPSGSWFPKEPRIVGLRSLSTAGCHLDHFQLIAAALRPWPPGLLHTPAHVLSLLTQGEQVPFQGSSEKTRSSWDNLPWVNSKPTALKAWGPSSHMKTSSLFVTEHNRSLCSHLGKRVTQHIHQGLGVISEFCLLYVLNCSWPGSGQGGGATIFSHRLQDGKRNHALCHLELTTVLSSRAPASGLRRSM